jgi:multidrug resistance efflux pump
MKKILILAVCLGIVAAVGSRLALRGDSSAAVDAKTTSRANERVAATGVIEGAHRKVELRPQVTGTLNAVNVRENAHVKCGEILVELANDVQKQQVAVAQAELEVAQVQLERVVNGERAEKRQALAAIVAAKKAVFEQAEHDYQRYTRGGAGVSSNELDSAKARYHVAKAEHLQANSEYELINAPARHEDVNEAKARVKLAEAKLTQVQAELEKTRLRAPSDGCILDVRVEAGTIASPTSAEPIIVMADLSKRRVRAYVEELDEGRVAVGQAARVTVNSRPGKVYTGKVIVLLPGMSKDGPHTDAPNELKDMYFRQVIVELDEGDDLPPSKIVEVQILTNDAP